MAYKSSLRLAVRLLAGCYLKVKLCGRVPKQQLFLNQASTGDVAFKGATADMDILSMRKQQAACIGLLINLVSSSDDNAEPTP